MTRVRFDKFFIYSLLALFALSILHTHAFASEASYKITSKMVSEQISVQLAKMGAAEKVQAHLTGYPSSVMASANSPLQVEISGLDYNANSRSWKAHMRVTTDYETVYSEDIQGRFNRLVAVPVLIKRMNAKDVITDLDVKYIFVPETRLRRDTITEVSALIGKSPRRVISDARPIRDSEIMKPMMVEKGKIIKVHYQHGGLHIHTLAEARESGAVGDIIPLENVQSESIIQARVLSDGNAEVVDYSQYSASSY